MRDAWLDGGYRPDSYGSMLENALILQKGELLDMLITTYAFMVSTWINHGVKPYNFAEFIYNRKLMKGV